MLSDKKYFVINKTLTRVNELTITTEIATNENNNKNIK